MVPQDVKELSHGDCQGFFVVRTADRSPAVYIESELSSLVGLKHNQLVELKHVGSSAGTTSSGAVAVEGDSDGDNGAGGSEWGFWQCHTCTYVNQVCHWFVSIKYVYIDALLSACRCLVLMFRKCRNPNGLNSLALPAFNGTLRHLG